MNPLVELHSHQQSFWLDFIRRDLVTTGALKRLIEKDGLRGMTSNPTIFEKAISTSVEYDADIRRSALQKKSDYEIFLDLAIKDIQKATDLLRPVYKSSLGVDGFVSLEVNPNLAYDTKGTIEEAKRLAKRVHRPNLMIKVPGTKEGVPAIEELTAFGLNINVTLLFSLDSYKQAVEAYIRGLERRLKKGLPVRHINSVASFFVSRVDTLIDKQLDDMISKGGPKAEAAQRLLHKAAIANSKIAYAHFQDVFYSNRFAKLRDKGANVQRVLWASTSTKDKRLRDVIYVEELIGPDTVNTMPPHTVDAFRDHGVVAPTLTRGFEEARKNIADLAPLGVNFDEATQKLQEQGVKLFIDSFNQLLYVVGAKEELLLGGHEKRQTFSLGRFKRDVDTQLKKIEAENWIGRLWSKDATLWKKEEEHQKIIKNSLGWLTVYETIKKNVKLLKDVTQDVKRGRFTHILLLGMGGSSLFPEVLRLTFGRKNGYPDLAILDSTEPASVLERLNRSNPEKTLYIVASKSGSTIEPNAFLSFFYDQVRQQKGSKAGDNFIAITDPGTVMEKIAKEKGFRHIVLNPADIGGRYSALSYFGMLPAALMGINIDEMLEGASRMGRVCSQAIPVEKNPGALLGTVLGVLAKAGRDKVTFFLSREIQSYGTWLEQLIAESSGKEGLGILPVESEEIQEPSMYGRDRVFVHIRLESDKDTTHTNGLKDLERAGHPVIRIVWGKKTDIGAECLRWEVATATACAVLGVDAFDQPNVQEAKDLTKRYLDEYKSNGKLLFEAPVIRDGDFSITIPVGNIQISSIGDIFSSLLRQAKNGDYVALLAYITRNAFNDSLLEQIRHAILNKTKVATTIGYGPRFLHSTGQLHKGGRNNGVFIQVVANDPKDVTVPGESYSFSILKQAQALGDFTALKNKGRRIVRVQIFDAVKDLPALKSILTPINP
ncbi:MAG: bifunctional transaldolase/phosoglucose isomerase [Elusimicrobia bacterium]|nr:bifunctional transaldolase/phosoglucose isomerase [Candidatus Obscuribacterium magneticum]